MRYSLIQRGDGSSHIWATSFVTRWVVRNGSKTDRAFGGKQTSAFWCCAVNIAVNNVRSSDSRGVGTLQGGIALTGVQSI